MNFIEYQCHSLGFLHLTFPIIIEMEKMDTFWNLYPWKYIVKCLNLIKLFLTFGENSLNNSLILKYS